jgi:ADP-ribosylglycohydrolase
MNGEERLLMDDDLELGFADEGVPTPKERFIGCLLGMAVGDALGMPAAGLTPAQVRERYDWIDGYRPRVDVGGAVLAAAGQVSAHTELALCLVESLVTSNGFVNPDTAGYRFVQLLDSEHAHLLDATSRAALEHARDTGDFQAGACGTGSSSAGPAARVAPVGLVHALGRLNAELLVREVLRATLITHAAPETVNGALAVAYAIDRVTRRETLPQMMLSDVLAFIDEDAVAKRLRVAERLLLDRGSPADDAAALAAIGHSDDVAEVVAAALYLFAARVDDFEGAVLIAANAGGASDAVGAIVGALAGAWVGGRALPERLVEGLESRMYVLMAAPALYRTAQRRGGLFLQLHQRR